MQHEGKIRNVGISGYPLPILLRLSVYLKEQTGKPLNYILSYSHLTLQSSLFLEYIPKFREEGGVENVLCASPFSMGLLSGPARPPPGWHPAPPALREAVKKAEQVIEEEGREMSEVALRYTIGQCVERGVPLLVGLSTPDEVHASVRNLRDVQEEKKHEGDAKAVERAKEVIREAGYLNWSWPSPPE
jgi:aryl-alcohol dehydrogenase-like predicted oxidoreductase